MSSVEDVAAALRFLTATDPHDPVLTRDRIARCETAVSRLLADGVLWDAIRSPVDLSANVTPVGWDRVIQALDDRFTTTMVTIGYGAGAEAAKPLRHLRRTIAAMQETHLPELTREELVGACRTGFRDLLRDLRHLAVTPEPAAADGARSVDRARFALLDALVLAQVVGHDERDITLRVRMIEAVTDDMVRWLTCHGHEEDPRQTGSVSP